MTNVYRFLIAMYAIQSGTHNAVATIDFNTIPNENLTVTLFDENVNHRTNMCEYQELYNNGTVALGDALRGAAITVALSNDIDFVNYDNNTNQLNSSDPGLMVELLDEIARRGGFTWRDTFTMERRITVKDDETWTDLLLWSIDTFDVSANWWLSIPSRISSGTLFPKGWKDSNLIIIARQDEDTIFEDTFRPFSWSQPFTAGVWASLFGTLTVSGVLFAYIENRKLFARGTRLRAINEAKYRDVTLSHIHEAFAVFTGHLDLRPLTNAGRLLSLSLSLFTMLIVLTYGANLASFLVIQRAASLTKIETVNDIVRMSMSICVYGDSAAHEVLQKVYATAIIVSKDNETETLTGLRAGDCDFALVTKSGWDMLQRMDKVNDGCALTRIGSRPFKSYDAGFAMQSAGPYCTTIVRNVFNLHLQNMTDDKTIEKFWDLYLEKRQLGQDMDYDSCLAQESASGETEGVETMDMITLSGIFLFHFVFLVLGLLFSTTGTRLKSLRNIGADHTDESSHSNDASPKSDSNNTTSNRISNTVHTSKSKRMDGIANTVEEHSMMLNEISSMLQEMHKKIDYQSPYSSKNDEESNNILQMFWSNRPATVR